MPADDFTSCKTKDDSNYDYFVCQFFDSLTRYQTTDPKGYWFGRLLAFDFTLDNLLGENFTEEDFREDLENSDLIFHSYTLLEVNYQSNLASLASSVEVTGKVEFDITINGDRQTVTRDFTHTIKPSWQSTGIVFTETF